MPNRVDRTRVANEQAACVYSPTKVIVIAGKTSSPWFHSPQGANVGLELPQLDTAATIQIKVRNLADVPLDAEKKALTTDVAEVPGDLIRIDAAGTNTLTLAGSVAHPLMFGFAPLQALLPFTGGTYQWQILLSAAQASNKLIRLPNRD